MSIENKDGKTWSEGEAKRLADRVELALQMNLMARRDRFAAAALNGLIANMRADKPIELSRDIMDVFASHAFGFADAMLVASQNKS